MRSVSLALTLLFATSVYAGDYLVGVSSVDITPGVPMVVMGDPNSVRFAEAGPYSDGLGITVRAVYIARPDQSEPVVLVACDLVNFAPFDTDFARDPDNYPNIPGLTRARIMINLTHTHNAPSSSESSVRVMAPSLQVDAAQDSHWRADILRPRLVQAIQAAYDNRAEANLRFHRNKLAMGTNRRSGLTADLTDANGTAVAEIGGYDHTLDVVEIRRDDQVRVGTLLFYGAHPVVLGLAPFPDGKHYHHPDFPGYARRRIEEETPENDIAIFFQAAGGDVNSFPGGGVGQAEIEGDKLGDRALAMMDDPVSSGSVISEEILPSQGASTAFSRVWNAPFETAAGNHRLGGGPGQPWDRNIMRFPAPGPGQPATFDWFRWADRYCEGLTGHGGGNPPCSLKAGVIPDRSWDIEMQTVTVGRWRIAGLSHEPVSQQGLKLRQRWPGDWVSVMGYVGRTQNYLPVSAQLAQDATCLFGICYEGHIAQLWNGHPAPWATYATTGGLYDLDAELQHVLKAETPLRVNYANAIEGATASASSTLDAGRAPVAAINGDRRGIHWGSDPSTGSGWHDATLDDFTNDRLEIDFHAPRTIDEIDVFSVQNDFMNPAEPATAMTATLYGLIDFKVEVLTSAGWTTVKNGAVSGNGLVWRRFAFAPLTATKIAVTVTSGGAGHSRIVEVEAWGDATSRPNVALASQGATASASSTLDGRTAEAAINGDRKGVHWGSDPATGSGWHDATSALYPDTLEIDFGASKTINGVNVYSVQDDFTNPSEPTPTMTFTQYGLVSFAVQWWDGTQWTALPGGTIANNDLVRRGIAFVPVTTQKIRVVVTGGGGGYSRIVEVEALTPYDFLSSVAP